MLSLRRLARDERGVSAIEYALLAALIALSMVASADALGSNLDKGLSEAESAFPDYGGGGNGGNGGNGNGNGKGKGQDKKPKDKGKP